MKNIVSALFCLLLAAPATAFGALRPPAEPVSALFYPNEVQVTVEEHLTPDPLPGGGKGFVLSLPGRAVPGSFSVSVDASPASSYYLLHKDKDIRALESPESSPQGTAGTAETPAKHPDQESNPDRRALLQAILDIRIEMEGHAAQVNAAQERLAFWSRYSPEATEAKPADIVSLDKVLGQTLPDLFAAKSRAERLYSDAGERLNEAEQALHRYDEGLLPQSRLVVVIPHSGNAAKPSLLRYTYVLPGSFRGSYLFGAFPGEGKLSIEQNAALTQQSGFNWKNVDVYISTTGRDTALQPRPLYPWIVRLFSKEDNRALMDTKSRVGMQAAPVAERMQMSTLDVSEEAMPAAPVPAQEEMGTFRLWSLGKRSIESDMPVTMTMAADSYKAKFYYTLRPALGSKGFLTAELSLDKALELPPGSARFFVDNSLVGERSVSLNGNKAILFFGTDPQVTAARRSVTQSSGEQGFFSKEQSLFWHWEITVRNTRGRAIEAWVEDPMPDARDDAVTLVVESSPTPEEVGLKPEQGGAKAYRWKLALEPGETKVIDHKVRIQAPQDKVLDPGRHD